MAVYTQLTATLAVAPQLSPADMQAIADAGFKSVINNRPDFEHGPDQPSAEQMAAAAKAVGLNYIHQPVDGGNIQEQDVLQFKANLAALPQPVLAFCRSGGRCTRLFTLSQQLA